MAVKTMVKAKKQSGAVSQNAFAGQADQPTQKAVEPALGNSWVLWKQLVAELKQEQKLDGEEWNSSGLKIRLVASPAIEEAQYCLSRAAFRIVHGVPCPG
jgi:hypothetical protein